MPALYTVEVVTRLERLRELEPGLHQLFARDRRATPFQAPDWLLAWAETFVAPGQLRVFVVRRAERLVLCLPLRLREQAGQRTLAWIGEGISDYLDALVDDAIEPQALQLARGMLQELSLQVDRVELSDLPDRSALPRLLEGASGARLEECARCPKLRLPAQPGDYEQVLPHWLRRNLQRTQVRLARRGALDWHSADAGNVAALLQVFFDLHGASWRARGEAGVLADANVRAFHQRAAPRLVARGMLDLSVLFVAGRPVAASYVLTRTDVHLYLLGYDPELAGVSLGSLLIWRSISTAIQQGRRQCDFLRGQEAYKYDWGAEDTLTQRLIFSPVVSRSSSASAAP
jgi:CelD/BcsL family acetyltransferase involved in cellulose biosynthesis